MVLTILGAPGAGKGTQANFLKEKLGIPIIATGNLLREAMRNGTEIGNSIRGLMDSGKLVPDELIVNLVSQRLLSDDCAKGAILDGFPRTISQAKALDKIVNVDLAISIEVGDDEIMERLTGREICVACQTTYHVEYNPTTVSGICDRCGSHTTRRTDDDKEIVKDRLLTYHKETEPVKNYYEEMNKLKLVEGQKQVDATKELVLKAAGVLL